MHHPLELPELDPDRNRLERRIAQPEQDRVLELADAPECAGMADIHSVCPRRRSSYLLSAEGTRVSLHYSDVTTPLTLSRSPGHCRRRRRRRHLHEPILLEQPVRIGIFSPASSEMDASLATTCTLTG